MRSRLDAARVVWGRTIGLVTGADRLKLAAAFFLNVSEVEIAFRGRPLRLRPGSSDIDVFTQVFVLGHYDVVYAEPASVVDGGANVGLSTILLADRHPEVPVIAVEPDPENFRLLQANTAGIPNVVPIQAGLAAAPGRLSLRDPGQGAWAIRTVPVDDGAVRAVTVAELVAEHGLDRIGLLKLDVEGAERELFADPSGWIERVDTIAVELHPDIFPDVATVFELAVRDRFPRRVTSGDLTIVSRS